MKKRLLSILLVFVIVLSTLPIPAFAEDGGEAAPTCICETACRSEDMNEDCPVCGAEGAHLHDCAKYVEGAENPAETCSLVKSPLSVFCILILSALYVRNRKGSRIAPLPAIFAECIIP